MSIWILAIALIALFAGIGFLKGAIRTAVSLVGVVLGLMLADSLGGVITPLVSLAGVKNPVWLAIVPPITAFFLVYFTFVGLSFFVHHKVNLYYKYKRDDADRIRWERLNKHTGLAVGALTGAIYFFAIAALIYAAGYLTVQVSAEENNPAVIKFINAARQGIEQTGIDRALAAIDPGNETYYEAADALALLYHNPLLQSRLATYPHFLSLAQNPEMEEIAIDPDYNKLIFGKAPVTQIIAHPRTQQIFNSPAIMQHLKQTDIEDLKIYLRTGKSPKYAEQEILGLWKLDKDAVITHIRKTQPDIRSRELNAIQDAINALPPITLAATPDNRVFIDAAGEPEPEPAAEEQPQPDPYALPERYRMRQPQQPAPAPAQPKPAGPSLLPKFAQEGSWTESAGQYIITVPDQSGNEITGTALVLGDELELTIAGSTLVFYRQ